MQTLDGWVVKEPVQVRETGGASSAGTPRKRQARIQDLRRVASNDRISLVATILREGGLRPDALMEYLRELQQAPVSYAVLRDTGVGKAVRSLLETCEDERIRAEVRRLLLDWRQVVVAAVKRRASISSSGAWTSVQIDRERRLRELSRAKAAEPPMST